MKRSTVWKRALVRKEALAVTVLLPLLTAAGADAQLSGSCGLVEPPGQCDNLPPQAYVEKSWGYLINARTAVEQTNWTCQGLPQLSGTFNPDPADRCYIDVPANKTVDQTANRHIFNGAKPVYVETKDGLQKYIVYYVQQNNSTGASQNNTPIRIDKTLRLYAVRDANGNWQQFDWGDRLDIELERTLNGRAINFHKLVHFSGVSYQLWQEGLTAPSGNHPCDLGFGTAPQPTQTYLDNRAQYSASGSTLEIYSLDGLDPFLDDPATLQQVLAHVTGPWDVSSRVRDHQFPSDYPAAITWISGFLQLPPQGNQVIGNRYVYAGTRDPLICEFPNGPHKGTGKGVFWGWFVFPDEDCSSPVGVP